MPLENTRWHFAFESSRSGEQHIVANPVEDAQYGAGEQYVNTTVPLSLREKISRALSSRNGIYTPLSLALPKSDEPLE